MSSLLIALALTLALTSVSCATMRLGAGKVGRALGIIDEPSERPAAEMAAAYREGLVLLRERKYQEALAAFNEYLSREPASPWTQAAHLNSGRALSGLGRWSEAAERFRAVVRATDSAPKLQATALYELSFAYEALGENQNTVATLSDLERRRESLPPEVAQAELPARLAGAYARVGNFELASGFYQRAEAGITRLKKEAGPSPAWLARTLYYMGRVPASQASWADFEEHLRPLRRAQIYLLQAAELGVEPYSGLAATELISSYRQLWEIIDKAPIPPGDPIIGRRAVQSEQWHRTALLLDSLQELKARALPAQTPSQVPGQMPGQEIWAFVADLEKALGRLLQERPAGEGLTEESARRRGSIRGRVVVPDSSLERAYKKRSGALPGAESVPDHNQDTRAQDPNL